MNEVVLFKSRASLTAEANVIRYIDHAKNTVTLWAENPEYEWSNPVWPTVFRRIRFINFSARGLHRSITPNAEHLMTHDYGEFAKAYIRYSQHIKQTQTVPRAMLALQLLEEAMIRLDGKPNIAAAQNHHFDTAGNILLENDIQDRTGVGGALEALGQHISHHKLSSNRISWLHPFKGRLSNPNSPQNITQEKKQEKLPSSDAIWAIAEVFANGYATAQDDEDIYITSTTAIFLSFPIRISELNFLREDPCYPEDDEHGNEQLYLKGFSPKTRRYMTKEVIDVMAPVTNEAIKRLQAITAGGRKLARYLESGNPHFYRHENCPDVPDDVLLTPDQVQAALGLKSIGSAESFLHQYSGHYSLTGYTLDSLWKIVAEQNKKFNPNFPYQTLSASGDRRLKMSESLMCLRYNQLSARNSTSPVLLAPHNMDYYLKRVTSDVVTPKGRKPTVGFFHKHKYGNIKVTSHQFRHLLTTLGQQQGVPVQFLTAWGSRASQQQTITYMHENPSHVAQ
ncbi:hypothetical protein [Pseudomonas aeruginosa]|nr:hypothetical protein [Pseudomonas aeruginosa]MBR7859836.1 hypothetical protein [Pseudomonas aeruginosa]